MTDNLKEREAFEAWILSELNYGYSLTRDAEGNYPHDATDTAWLAWQGRAALAEAAQSLPDGFGGGLVAIKTLLGRDPCAHATTAIAMIDEMLAASPAQPVQPSDPWLPIETAPKDGAEIIMSNGKDVSAGSWFKGHDGTYDRDGAPNCDEKDACWMDWSGGMLPEPTHWMPLPAAPQLKD